MEREYRKMGKRKPRGGVYLGHISPLQRGFGAICLVVDGAGGVGGGAGAFEEGG